MKKNIWQIAESLLKEAPTSFPKTMGDPDAHSKGAKKWVIVINNPYNDEPVAVIGPFNSESEAESAKFPDSAHPDSRGNVIQIFSKPEHVPESIYGVMSDN